MDGMAVNYDKESAASFVATYFVFIYKYYFLVGWYASPNTAWGKNKHSILFKNVWFWFLPILLIF